jgi:DNA-directed RNA polymerase subunit F
MLEVIVDKEILKDYRNAESNPVDYLFSSIVFLYNYLGKNSKYSEEFEIHSDLLEGTLIHFDSSSENLSSEEISKLLENIREKYMSKLNEIIPVSPEDAGIVQAGFSKAGQDLVVSERAAFFTIIRDSRELKKFNDSREIFWSIIFNFYRKLGSYIYWLKDQNDESLFRSKVKKALTPSLNPEDVCFEFSVALDLKNQNIILKFVLEKEGVKTTDFEIYFENEFFGHLECTVRRQKNRELIHHVSESLRTKADQMQKASGEIKCLAISLPYDLEVKKIKARVVSQSGVKHIFLADENGGPLENSDNEILEIVSVIARNRI